jgi:hypothetical protein
MLDEFRALGGTAENVCLREGRFGRGLFPADPSKPIRLNVPESLLIDSRWVEFEGDKFRLSAEASAGARERTFLEKYQQNFSWGVYRHQTEDLLRLMQESPPELREAMKGSTWLAGPTPEAIRERFFAARRVVWEGRTVLVPVIELANHGHTTVFKKNGGIGLSGQFEDEILVRYRLSDPLQIFNHWGFASPEEFAFSIPLTLNTRAGLLVIGLVQHTGMAPGQNPFIPKVARDSGRMTLSFLMLGHKNHPRLARGIFYRIMRDAGWPGAEEVFDWIQHLNRVALYRIIAASEGAVPALAKLVREVALCQLDAMSHSVGAREV